MAETQKALASQADFLAHLRADYRAAHGIWAQVKAALAIVANNFYDNTANDATGLYIQIGHGVAIAALGTAITFDQAFTVTPSVVGNAEYNGSFFVATSISTTGFTARCWGDDGVAYARTGDWIAIGKK